MKMTARIRIAACAAACACASLAQAETIRPGSLDPATVCKLGNAYQDARLCPAKAPSPSPAQAAPAQSAQPSPAAVFPGGFGLPFLAGMAASLALALLAFPLFLARLRPRVPKAQDMRRAGLDKGRQEAYLAAREAFPEWIVSPASRPAEFFELSQEAGSKPMAELSFAALPPAGFLLLNKADATPIAWIVDEQENTLSAKLALEQTAIPSAKLPMRKGAQALRKAAGEALRGTLF